MDLQISHRDDITIFRVQSQPREEDLRTLIKRVTNFCRGGKKKFIFDITGLAHLASTDIAILVNVNDAVKEHGGRVVLTGIKPRVSYILDVTNLRPFFEIHESFAHAVAALGGGADMVIGQKPGSVPPDSGDRAQRRFGERFVREVAKSRLHVRLLEIFDGKRLDIISVKSLADLTGESASAVAPVLADLTATGVLREAGGGTYNYAPSAEHTGDIRNFLRLWTDTRWHSELLSLILAREGKSDA